VRPKEIAGCFIPAELAFSQPEPAVMDPPFSAVDLFVQNHVKHFVKQDVLDDILRNQGMIQPSTQCNCLVGRIIMPEGSAAFPVTPSQVIDLQTVIEILPAKIIKQLQQIENLPSGRAQLLAASL
jgi:hypothetical protein